MNEAPLAGRRIIVTRSQEQAGSLVDQLRALGAEPLVCPPIRIEPSVDEERLRACVDRLSTYHWLMFTSANAVRLFAQHLKAFGVTIPENACIASIGAATSQAIKAQDWPVSIETSEVVAEALLEEIGDVQGSHILMPGAAAARDVLPLGLRERGATVDILALYRTVPGEGIGQAIQLLQQGTVHAITFTSSSTVEPLLEGMEGEGMTLSEAPALVNRTRVVCIGPASAETARGHGLRVDAVPEEHTAEGIVAVLTRLFALEAVS